MATAAERQRASRAAKKEREEADLAAGGEKAQAVLDSRAAAKTKGTQTKTAQRGKTRSKGSQAAKAVVDAASSQPERVQIVQRERKTSSTGNSTWGEGVGRMVPAHMVAEHVAKAASADISIGIPEGHDQVTTSYLSRANQTAANPPSDDPIKGFVEVSTGRTKAQKEARADKGVGVDPVTRSKNAGGSAGAWLTNPGGAAREGARDLAARDVALTEAARKVADIHIPDFLSGLAAKVKSGEMKPEEARLAHDKMRAKYPDSYGKASDDAASGFGEAHDALMDAYGKRQATQQRIVGTGRTLVPTANMSDADLSTAADVGRGDTSGSHLEHTTTPRLFISPADLAASGRLHPVNQVEGDTPAAHSHRTLGLVGAYASALAAPHLGGAGVIKALRQSGHNMALNGDALPTANNHEEAVDIHQARLDAIEDQANDAVMSHPMNQDLFADAHGTAQHGEANFLVAHAKAHGVDASALGTGTAAEVGTAVRGRQHEIVNEHVRQNVIGVSQKEHLGQVADSEREVDPNHGTIGGLPKAFGHVEIPEEHIPPAGFKQSSIKRRGFNTTAAEDNHFAAAAENAQSRLLLEHAQSPAGATLHVDGKESMDSFERAWTGARVAATARREAPGTAAAVHSTAAAPVRWQRSPSAADTASDVQSQRAVAAGRMSKGWVAAQKEHGPDISQHGFTYSDTGEGEHGTWSKRADNAAGMGAGNASSVGVSKVEKPQWLQQREAGQTPDIEKGLPERVAAEQRDASTRDKAIDYAIANAHAANAPHRNLGVGGGEAPSRAPVGYVGGAPRSPRALETVTPGRMTAESRRKPGLSSSDVTPEALAETPGVTPRNPDMNAPKVSPDQVRQVGGRTQLGTQGDLRVKTSGKRK